jgi:hypothetical protein
MSGGGTVTTASNNETMHKNYNLRFLINLENCSLRVQALEQLIAVHGSAPTTVLVMGIGILESVANCPYSAMEANWPVVTRLLLKHKSGPVVWISPSYVADWKFPSGHRSLRHSMTTEQMTRLYEKWKTVGLSQPFLMLDSFQMAASMWDRSHDGIHHYSRSADLIGGPTSKWTMMVLANMICSRKDSEPDYHYHR